MPRNIHFLLSLTLAFPATIATVSTVLVLPSPGPILTLVGIYGLVFLTYRTVNKPAGIISIFAFTGFLGCILGPILNTYLPARMGGVIAMALGGTVLMFFYCSAYVLITREDMSFLGGVLMADTVMVLAGMVANTFLQLSVLHLVINAVLTLISSDAILFGTNSIVHGGETNYVRATVNLHVSLYSISVNLLSIPGFISCDQSRPGLFTELCFMRGFVFCYTAASLIKIVKNYADFRR